MRKAEGQKMPTGEPKFPQDDANGGGLEETPEPKTVEKGEASATLDYDDTYGKAPKSDEEKLSEDDAEVEQQMKPHTKPIEKTTRKSMAPADQRDLSAQRRAAAVARLQKSQDVTLHPYSNARMSAGVEDQAERLIKGEFYTETPSLAPALPVIAQGVLCKSCGHSHTAAVTACPHCGSGTTVSQILPGIQMGGDAGVLQKSAAPVLRPAKREADHKFAGGMVPRKE